MNSTPVGFNVVALLFILCAAGCASSYKQLNPASFSYSSSYEIKDTLKVSYLFKSQRLVGNMRYDKRERRYSMASVAVKIENLTDSAIFLTRENFRISSPTANKSIYTPTTYAKKVKQWGAVHLLHALWGPWAIKWEENQYGETDVDFIYIPVGAIVGIANAAKASKANGVNLATQQKYEIWNKEIRPHQTLFGLVAIPSATQNDTLRFQFTNRFQKPQYQNIVAKPFILPDGPTSLVHDFYVIMKDGSQATIETKIEVAGEEYFIRANKSNFPKIIRPSDTQTLSRMSETGKQLLGVPNGNAWLFKIIDGQVSAYYFLAEESTEVVSHLQKDGGPLVPFSPEVLEEMVGANPDLTKLIKKKKYVQAINEYNEMFK